MGVVDGVEVGVGEGKGNKFEPNCPTLKRSLLMLFGGAGVSVIEGVGVDVNEFVGVVVGVGSGLAFGVFVKDGVILIVGVIDIVGVTVGVTEGVGVLDGGIYGGGRLAS